MGRSSHVSVGNLAAEIFGLELVRKLALSADEFAASERWVHPVILSLVLQGPPSSLSGADDERK
jgi:hypothetical protein